MSKEFFVTIFTILFAMTLAANMDTSKTETRESISSVKKDSREAEIDQLNMDMIMKDCNESFRIEMSYLESLNESGSFIDETDRTPKCFIRCMLMNMEVVTQNGIFDPVRAAALFSGERNGKPMGDISEMSSTCAVRNEACLCDRAYQFMRCLMSMEIEKYEPKRQ